MVFQLSDLVKFCHSYKKLIKIQPILQFSATEFYEEQVDRLTKDFIDEREKSLKHPVGIVFITFDTINQAKEVFDSFRRSVLQCNFDPPRSSISSLLKPQNWKVSFASTPDDIYWENLNVSRKYLTLKYFLINIGLFFTAFFLTTPEYLVSQTDWLVRLFGQTLKLPAPIIDFLPTILLWSFTALLPLLVAYSDRWLGHYTRSEENHNIMKKTFWYLLVMVIFFPTFGFTTAQASIEFLFKPNNTDAYRWDCVFLPDSGAFFVNYVITAALVGSGLELIRFPDMFWYFIQVCLGAKLFVLIPFPLSVSRVIGHKHKFCLLIADLTRSPNIFNHCFRFVGQDPEQTRPQFAEISAMSSVLANNTPE